MGRSQIGGGTLFTSGVVGMTSLLLADGLSETSLWEATWFRASFAAVALMTLGGAYIAASAYIPLPMPRTLEERQQLSSELGDTARFPALPQVPTVEHSYVGSGVTPEFLISLCRDVTAVQGERTAAIYIGKRMIVSRTVTDVQPPLPLLNVVPVLSTGTGPEADVSMWFPKDSLERLEQIPKGARITVDGLIHAINGHSLTLNECELVDA